LVAASNGNTNTFHHQSKGTLILLRFGNVKWNVTHSYFIIQFVVENLINDCPDCYHYLLLHKKNLFAKELEDSLTLKKEYLFFVGVSVAPSSALKVHRIRK